MSREYEQFAYSINTSEIVVNYLMDVLDYTEQQVTRFIFDNEPTPELIHDIFDANPNRDYFFWGDVEYTR